MASEKKGQTGKLKYDFNTARAVYIKSGDKYSRITERDFRSYCGERFILDKNNYIPYDGPIYYWNTNKICDNPIYGQVQLHEMEKRSTYIRPHERHLLDNIKKEK